MLKLIFSCSFTVLISCSSQSFYQGTVAFNSELLPQCYVEVGDDYWSWRDAKKISSNVDKDLKVLLLNSEVFYSEQNKISYDDLELALCDRRFLLSPQLATVMNFYGGNTPPSELYYDSLNRISKLRGVEPTDVYGLIKILKSSLQDLEIRFE